MNEIFRYTNGLCNALQRREQYIINAMDLLEFTMVELTVLREDSGRKEFLKNVSSFCEKHKVKIVDMDGKYKPIQRDKKFYKNAINYHRFHADMFLGVIDRQLVELNNRFDEVNTKLLRCMAELSMMLVKTDKILRYDIVYKLLKLVLVLPVATAGVERIFSSMNYIKNKLRSKMGQNFLNGCLVTFIEREFFLEVKDEDIIAQFQSMKDRKVRL